MNKARENLSWFMTGIIFVGLGFAAGYTMSELVMKNDKAPSVTMVSAVETPLPEIVPTVSEYTPEPSYWGVRYLISVENGYLILYETDGENKKILRKSKINMNSFPQSDVKDLKNGITTGTLEGALQIWEGFAE